VDRTGPFNPHNYPRSLKVQRILFRVFSQLSGGAALRFVSFLLMRMAPDTVSPPSGWEKNAIVRSENARRIVRLLIGIVKRIQ
jgi:hypothetical protein